MRPTNCEGNNGRNNHGVTDHHQSVAEGNCFGADLPWSETADLGIILFFLRQGNTVEAVRKARPGHVRAMAEDLNTV